MASDINEHPTPFNTVKEWSGRALFVTATGEVELVNSPHFESALDRALTEKPDVLVADITNVTFLSSAGLAVLMRAHRSAESAGTSFRVVAANPATTRPIQLMGLDQEFDVFADRDGALAGAPGL